MPLEYALQHRSAFPAANPYKYLPAQQVFDSAGLGIGSISHQVVRRSRQTPFNFNIMVAGETGLGKTTFINTLFHSELLEKKQQKTPEKTVQISAHDFELEENGVLLHLTVVDTPGFGDAVNREQDILPIVDYIDTQFEAFYRAESSGGFRSRRADNRVHVLVYFLAPSTHGLKELDIHFLRTLSTKTNVIPVIAKADTLSSEEKAKLKEKINKELSRLDIKVYPSAFADDKEACQDVEPLAPFTLIGSNKTIDNGTKKIRGRVYRWGFAEVENPAHCDFVHLRSMIMKTNMLDLVDTCHSIHYHSFRTFKLRRSGRHDSLLKSDDQYESQVDMKRKNFYEELSKRENEMRQKFYQKIKEKEQALREAEEILAKKEQSMIADLEEQRRQLDTEERELESAAGTSKKGKSLR